MSEYLLGIDLGGTKIEAVLVPRESPVQPVCRLRVPTGQIHGYSHIINQIMALCRQVEKETGIPLPPLLGLGHPGTLDPQSGQIKCSNTQVLNGRRLKEDLENALGRSMILENDANCFAMAEALHGAAQGRSVVFGMILGTGVGGGLVVHGRVLHGCHGIAGEWGQWVLEPSGPESVYGTRGTVEAYLCGPALERHYQQLTGDSLPLPEIASRAGNGDPAAVATLEHLRAFFARGVAMLVNGIDPDAFVIGGGVGNLPLLYSRETRDEITRNIFQSNFSAEILHPLLGDSAGVFGAALLTQ
jgi:fructokinase